MVDALTAHAEEVLEQIRSALRLQRHELSHQFAAESRHHLVHHLLAGLVSVLLTHLHQLLVVDHRQRRRFIVRHVRRAVVDARAVVLAILLQMLETVHVVESVGVLLAVTQHAVLQRELAEAHVAVERTFATKD